MQILLQCENPLEDITILESIDFVMKGGKVIKEPKII